VALSCSGMVLPTWASPPPSRPADRRRPSHPPHLNLRPPSARGPGDFAARQRNSAFPGAVPGQPGNSDSNLPAWAPAPAKPRVDEPGGVLLRDVFTARTAGGAALEKPFGLISLGLNAKGKPGCGWYKKPVERGMGLSVSSPKRLSVHADSPSSRTRIGRGPHAGSLANRNLRV